MPTNVLPYRTPEPPKPKSRWLGAISILFAAVPVLFALRRFQAVDGRFMVIAGCAWGAGLICAAAAVIRYRASGAGWAGLVLNGIPLVGLLQFWWVFRGP